MHLSPQEKDKLLIFSAALLAERRLNRGLKLNYPETIAFLSFLVLEGARDGKSVSQLMSEGTTWLSKSKINNLVGNIKKIFNESDNHLSIGILENGISVRFLGSSSQDARKCFFCIWKQIRSVCGFCEPKYQGVWPLQDSMNY